MSTQTAVDDRQTIQEAARWLRFLATEAFYRPLHAIEADSLMDLTLRFDEMRERISKTGVLQGSEESDMERLRRTR